MGRAKKKPEYDQNRIMEQFQNCIVEAYTSGIADGTGISLRQVSEEFGITLMKTRKILITAGIYHTENSEQINSMRKQGMNIPEIMKATGLSKSSVHSYLPYTKMIYNVDELSLYAERCRMYRKRKQAIEQLQICKGASLECVEKYLWSTIEIFSGYSFTTVKGLRFRYGVNGNEIQINRKKKSITRSSVKVANKCGIDGIAYLSMQGEDEFQFPQGVNLAIPATDISENRRYSEKCEGFEISKPVKYQGQEEKNAQSYINKIYKKYDEWGWEEHISKLDVDGKEQFYGETIYGKFDNYLVSHMKREEACSQD